MRTFVSAAEPSGDQDTHVIRPNRRRSRMTVAQLKAATAHILAVPGVNGCLFEVRTNQIRVQISAKLTPPKRVRVLSGVLDALARLRLHDPTEGVESEVPGLS